MLGVSCGSVASTYLRRGNESMALSLRLSEVVTLELGVRLELDAREGISQTLS